jgi:cyclic pyranopterin phosphate synthase
MVNSDKPTPVYWLDSSLYLNITNQCSNRCWFCFRNYKKGVSDFNLKFVNEPALIEITSELEKILPSRRWHEIVFCGFGEPTARLDVLLDVARWIKMRYPSIPIRLDTNGHGYYLNKGRDVAAELSAAGISRASVSLNGYTEETYSENCRPQFSGGFAAVLEFISKAKVYLEVEISAVRMSEVDIEKVKAIADDFGVPFRVREYIPCFW